MAIDGPVVKVPVAYEHRFDDAKTVETFNTRIGRCYELALRAQLNMSIYGWDTTLVHGTIGPWNNPHAWLEWRDNAGKRWSWDSIEDGIMPSAQYKVDMYAVIWTRYAPKQACNMFIKLDSNGPWGKRNIERAIVAIEGMMASGHDTIAGQERLLELKDELKTIKEN